MHEQQIMPILGVLAEESIIYTNEEVGYLATGHRVQQEEGEGFRGDATTITLWLIEGPNLRSIAQRLYQDKPHRVLDDWGVAMGESPLGNLILNMIAMHEEVEREYTVHVWTTLTFDGIMAKGAEEAQLRGDCLAADFLGAAKRMIAAEVDDVVVPDEMENHRLITYCEDGVKQDMDNADPSCR